MLYYNLIGLSNENNLGGGVIIDIHTLKMTGQRLKENKYCPKFKWVERAKIKVLIEFMYFPRLYLFSLHTAISVNKKCEWLTWHQTVQCKPQTRAENPCSSSLSLTTTSSHPYLLGSLFHPLKPSPHDEKPVFLMFMNCGLEERTCMCKCSLLILGVFFSIPFQNLLHYSTRWFNILPLQILWISKVVYALITK